MKNEKAVIIEISGKGMGVVANVSIKKDEIILTFNLEDTDRIVTAEEAKLLTDFEQNHLMPLGDEKYALDTSIPGIVNHSCEPNSYVDFDKNFDCKLIALKDIEVGEEITKDYSLAAFDQIDNDLGWIRDCACGSKDCRKKIQGDFFKMSKDFQLQNLKYLPQYFKEKYADRVSKLLQ